MRSAFIAAFLTLTTLPARADDLRDLLREGPVVSVRTGKDNKFDRAVAVADVKAPPTLVWRVITDFANYRLFVPKLLKSDVRSSADGEAVVAYEVDAPIINVRYTFRYELDPAAMVARGRWVDGALKDSFCEWKVEPADDGSLVYFTAAARHFSALAEQLEDKQQTITMGINLVGAMSILKAVKTRAESLASAPAEPPDAGHP
jgi:ribosome-associated toxin RatA of RatAB toxin-antitoxin module